MVVAGHRKTHLRWCLP